MERSDLFVKICGVRDVASAQAAVDAGADALGFIFAPARRQVSPESVREIGDVLRVDPASPKTLVGVFVNASVEEIGSVTAIAGLDSVQLSGDESPSILQELELPVIKALRFSNGTSLDAAFAELDAWYAAPKPAMRVIVKGRKPGSYGGTGTAVDWDLAAALAARYPIILAGGLSPENVGEAVTVVNPVGVDVSSGVETDGVKDAERIRSFIWNAHLPATRPDPG